MTPDTATTDMAVDEFRAEGLLFEINRRILHPLGLALAGDSGTNTFHVIRTPRSAATGALQPIEVDPNKHENIREAWGPLDRIIGVAVEGSPFVLTFKRRLNDSECVYGLSMFGGYSEMSPNVDPEDPARVLEIADHMVASMVRWEASR